MLGNSPTTNTHAGIGSVGFAQGFCGQITGLFLGKIEFSLQSLNWITCLLINQSQRAIIRLFVSSASVQGSEFFK